jgi:hypothetical protein
MNNISKSMFASNWAGILLLATSPAISDAADCKLDQSIQQATVDQIAEYFTSLDKRVVTFVGYSGAGYEDRKAMLTEAGEVLEEFDPADTIVNIGATPDGIGAVYELAVQHGFVTTGIVSTQAQEHDARISPCVGHVFYVEDETWGGFIDGGKRLSPTSAAMVAVSDLMVGIGGGEVARDELLSAKSEGREVRFIAADMNHAIAIEKAAKRGLPGPTDFSGAASKAL